MNINLDSMSVCLSSSLIPLNIIIQVDTMKNMDTPFAWVPDGIHWEDIDLFQG